MMQDFMKSGEVLQEAADRNGGLNEANKYLNENIASLTKRNQELDSKLSEVKVYQKLFKQSMSIQCKYCKCFLPTYEFQQHT
jgi:prefoldin subunit 5